ncbi:hypothetical protein [Bacillus horti]|uniref:hypothetical protein n=1 Tax=Caldalkalibacillus horti TaxID=77523 RepID=UPI0031D2C34E
MVWQTRCSIVVQLIDAYTGGTPVGNDAVIYLEGSRQRPIQKDQGTYVFTDLPTGTYNITIQSEYYMPARKEVIVEQHSENKNAYSVTHIVLFPTPAYPVHQGATILRAMLRDSNGAPLSGVLVRAMMRSREASIARLSRDATKASDQLFISQVQGVIAVGDQYTLQSSIQESEVTQGECQIAQIMEAQKKIKLVNPLTKAMEKGTYLLPIVQAYSDSRGELLVIFRSTRLREFEATLRISYLDQSIGKEVRILTGDVHQLGAITLPK